MQNQQSTKALKKAAKKRYDEVTKGDRRKRDAIIDAAVMKYHSTPGASAAAMYMLHQEKQLAWNAYRFATRTSLRTYFEECGMDADLEMEKHDDMNRVHDRKANL